MTRSHTYRLRQAIFYLSKDTSHPKMKLCIKLKLLKQSKKIAGFFFRMFVTDVNGLKRSDFAIGCSAS